MKLPPYENFPKIISDRIVLIQIEENDIKDIISISFYDAKPALTDKDASEMQHKINLDYQNGLSIHWGIADKQTNEIVGTLGYYRGLDKGIGELGFVLKPEFQGQGFMTLAIQLAINFGLNTTGLTKIIAITTKQNNNAIKLLERLNFIKVADLEYDEIEFEFKQK